MVYRNCVIQLSGYKWITKVRALNHCLSSLLHHWFLTTFTPYSRSWSEWGKLSSTCLISLLATNIVWEPCTPPGNLITICRKFRWSWLWLITTGSVRLKRSVASVWGAQKAALAYVIGPTCWPTRVVRSRNGTRCNRCLKRASRRGCALAVIDHWHARSHEYIHRAMCSLSNWKLFSIYSFCFLQPTTCVTCRSLIAEVTLVAPLSSHRASLFIVSSLVVCLIQSRLPNQPTATHHSIYLIFKCYCYTE